MWFSGLKLPADSVLDAETHVQTSSSIHKFPNLEHRPHLRASGFRIGFRLLIATLRMSFCPIPFGLLHGAVFVVTVTRLTSFIEPTLKITLSIMFTEPVE